MRRSAICLAILLLLLSAEGATAQSTQDPPSAAKITVHSDLKDSKVYANEVYKGHPGSPFHVGPGTVRIRIEPSGTGRPIVGDLQLAPGEHASLWFKTTATEGLNPLVKVAADWHSQFPGAWLLEWMTVVVAVCCVGFAIWRLWRHRAYWKRYNISQALAAPSVDTLEGDWGLWAREIATRHAVLEEVAKGIFKGWPQHRQKATAAAQVPEPPNTLTQNSLAVLPVLAVSIVEEVGESVGVAQPVTPAEAIVAARRTRRAQAQDVREHRQKQRLRRWRKSRARRLAATELFVEKAQGTLANRALLLTALGTVCTALGTGALIIGAAVLLELPQPPDDLQVPAMIVRAIRGIAVGGFFLGAAGFVLYLSKAMFHEATQLISRRHALRFGRLYLHLKDGRFDQFEHLERAFQWTGEFSTGFKDIKHELPRGLIGDFTRLAQSVSETTKAVGEAASAVAKVKSGG